MKERRCGVGQEKQERGSWFLADGAETDLGILRTTV